MIMRHESEIADVLMPAPGFEDYRALVFKKRDGSEAHLGYLPGRVDTPSPAEVVRKVSA